MWTNEYASRRGPRGLGSILPILLAAGCGSSPSNAAPPVLHFVDEVSPMPCWMEGARCCLDAGEMCGVGSIKVEGDLVRYPDVVRDLSRSAALPEIVKYVRSRARTELVTDVAVEQKGHCRESLFAMGRVDESGGAAAQKQIAQLASRASNDCDDLDEVEKSMLSLLSESSDLILTGVYRDGLWENGRGTVHFCYRVTLEDLKKALYMPAGGRETAEAMMRRLFPEAKPMTARAPG